MNKLKLKFSTIGFLMLFCSVAISQPGTLDNTFDGDGKLLLGFGTSSSIAKAVAVQNDGKIVVAGQTAGSGSADFAVARINPDGTLDNSFDFDGKVTTDFNNYLDDPNAIAIQPDGKIIVAGYTYFNTYSFALARYNTDGSLDNSFGTGGLIITSITDNDEARAIAVQDDGKILLAGMAHADGNYSDFVIVRYMPDGSFDNSFGTGGKILTDFLGYHDEAYGIAVQSDGKIVAIGASSDENSSVDFAIVRYNSDGSFDSSFGDGGKVRTDFDGGIDIAKSIVIQPNGKIILGGYAHTSSYGNDFAVARYNTDGLLDISFNLNGKVTSSFINDYTDLGYSVVLQDDGKIILAGYAHSGIEEIDFGMVRYNADGSHDFSFGFLGWVLVDFDGYLEECFSVALQPDNKIVLAGYSTEDGTEYNFALARFLSGLEIGVIDFTEITNQFFVYPNPISSSSTLKFSLLKKESISIKLYDSKGTLIQIFKTNQEFPIGPNNVELNFNTDITTGYYNLVIRNDKGSQQSIRILKK